MTRPPFESEAPVSRDIPEHAALLAGCHFAGAAHTRFGTQLYIFAFGIEVLPAPYRPLGVVLLSVPGHANDHVCLFLEDLAVRHPIVHVLR